MELSASMVAKLGDLNDRFEEVSALLSDAETMADREKFTALSKEFAEIEPVVLCYQKVTVLQDSLEENTLLLDDEDPDLRELAEQEIAEAKDQMAVLFAQLQTLLLPRDPNDQSNVLLEIRAPAPEAMKPAFSSSPRSGTTRSSRAPRRLPETCLTSGTPSTVTRSSC